MSERKPILLRLNPALWEEIGRWASHELRSVNGQIEYILQDAVRKRVKSFREEGDAKTESKK